MVELIFELQYTGSKQIQLLIGSDVAGVRPAPKTAVPQWHRKDHANVAICPGNGASRSLKNSNLFTQNQGNSSCILKKDYLQ
jgi:hypothetical protein